LVFFRDQSTACQNSILMTFAAHTELKCIAHEWENQNFGEENRVTLSTGELFFSEMQQPKKSKEVTHIEINNKNICCLMASHWLATRGEGSFWVY